MRKVKRGSELGKELKGYKKDSGKVEKVYDIVGFLEGWEDIGKEFKGDMVWGNYGGEMECDVENDFVLIWIDDEVVKLVRVGSDWELLGKKKKG